MSVQAMSWVFDQGFEPSLERRLLLIANDGDSTAAELAEYGFHPVASSERVPERRKAHIPSALRKAVFERDAYRCVSCGVWRDLSVDHVVPEILGGPTTLENLRTRCRRCNSSKGARMPGPT